MNIKYGSKFLIYADSGYGKSTIIKILLKYFEEYLEGLVFQDFVPEKLYVKNQGLFYSP